MKMFDGSDSAEDSIPCKHCGNGYTLPLPQWDPFVPAIKIKDTIYSHPAGVLLCGSCNKLTQVHLMFSKGNTYLHTVAW